MNRLLVHVEGETEESFVNEILRPHLVGCGYHNVSARLLGNARQRTNRGGIKSWESVRLEIERHLKGDVGVMATTMVDYYALPDSWPGRVKARSAAVGDKPGIIEGALRDDLARRMGAGFDKNRFVPFVTMHEFESLLFSNCSAFARGIGRSKLEGAFQKIRDQFESPEEIDDSPQTAPSKRVEVLVPDYEKPLHGTLAALEVGLESMREECPHFDQWLTDLEGRHGA